MIAINSVINWSFFLLYIYIWCFSIFSSNFVDSKSFVKICNQFSIRRMDTWHRRTRDHSTRHKPLGLPTYRRFIVTKSLSPAVSEIMDIKHIGVMTLTFQGHVTSSVTWPFDSQVPISYRYSIVTKSLSPAVSEIMGTKHIGVMTLTLQGHVTSSVRWQFDSQVAISYRCSIVTKSLYLQPFSR